MNVWTPEAFQQDILNQHPLVLVSFSAEWCEPSRLQVPILQTLRSSYADRAHIEIFDVDQQTPLADHWQVRTLPASLLFAKGELVEALAGFQAREYLQEYLDYLSESLKQTPTT
ncbi:MAG TPA: thioredoxin family protein [Candidatus Ozemobacteraceae bacterium]|nr:thioredoxin family protein [Candidatus Ozemobacteraceae bacterium]